MKPGATIRPIASINSVAVAFGKRPIATSRPFLIAASFRIGAAPEPSTTLPPTMRMSYLGSCAGEAAARSRDAEVRQAVVHRLRRLMRRVYLRACCRQYEVEQRGCEAEMTEAGSADCRSQTVVCPGGAAAGPGNSRRRENK